MFSNKKVDYGPMQVEMQVYPIFLLCIVVKQTCDMFGYIEYNVTGPILPIHSYHIRNTYFLQANGYSKVTILRGIYIVYKFYKMAYK